MEKISKLMGLLLLGLAGVGQAADPFYVACESVEEVDGDYSFDCSVYQSATGEYETWSDVIFAIRDEISMKESDVKSISITLESDITFDALPSDPASCTNSTTNDAQLYSSDWVNAGYNFDGANHTIKNFCLIGERGQSDIAFFKEYKNGSIKNVIFDNAYVMAKADDSEEAVATAAVVVARANGVAYENVTVKNSHAYGFDVGAVVAFDTSGSFKNITVSKTDVGTPEDVFPDYSNFFDEPGPISSSSRLAGVVGYAEETSDFAGIKLTEVTIGVNNVSYVSFGKNSEVGELTQNVRNRLVGGVVGEFISTKALSIKEGSFEVSLGHGSKMGGLFGSFDANSNVEISGVKVSVNVSPSCEEYQYIGALVGIFDEGKSDLKHKFSKDTVTILSELDGSKNCRSDYTYGSLWMGGLIGYADNSQLSGHEVRMEQNLVSNKMSLSYTGVSLNAYVGGSIGYAKGHTVVDSLNVFKKDSIEIKGSNNTGVFYVGGLYGRVGNAVALGVSGDTVAPIINVSGVKSDDAFFGGVVGYINGASSSVRNNVFKSGAITVGIDKNVSDSHVRMGGVAGSGSSENDFVVDSNTIDVDLLVHTAVKTGKHIMGGVFGNLGNSGDVLIGDNVVSSVIRDSSSISDSVIVGGLIGSTYKGSNEMKIYRNTVSGDIIITPSGIVVAGGFMGWTRVDDALYLANNRSIGNIAVSSNAAGVNGFIAGFIQTGMKPVKIVGNYHVGTSDGNVSLAVGSYLNGNSIEVPWVSTSDVSNLTDICFNYRNAIVPTDATVAEWRWDSGWFYSSNTYILNGVLSSANMKTLAFAHNLNNGVATKITDDSDHFYPSWGSDGTSYPYFISKDSEAYPRKLTVAYDQVVSQMPENFETVMADYIAPGTENQFTAYSTGDGSLDENFVSAYESLMLDVGVVDPAEENVLSKKEISARTSLPASMQTTAYDLLANPSFTISYEYVEEDEETGGRTYSDFGDDAVFLTPYVSSAKIFDYETLIPLIKVKVGEEWVEYRAVYYILECSDDAMSCNNLPFTWNDWSGYTHPTFGDILASISQAGDLSDYKTTIRMIYKKVSLDLPAIVFANSGAVTGVGILGSSYGSNSAGTLVEVGTGRSPTSSDYATMQFGSKVKFKPTTGFTETGWTVDFWLSYGELYPPGNIVSCYDESAPDFCTDYTIAASTDGSVGSVAGLTDTLRMGNVEKLWKWTISIKAGESIDLENLLLAIESVKDEFEVSPSLFMRVTPKGTVNTYTISFIPNESGLDHPNDIFFADSWNGSGEYSLESSNLPLIYSPTESFGGWTVTSEQTRNTYTYSEISSKMLDEASVTDYNFTVYGSWNGKSTSESRSLFLVAKAPDAEPKEDEGTPLVYLNGTVELYQTYVVDGESKKVTHSFGGENQYTEGETYAREYRNMEIPDIEESMTFYVTGKPNNGYRLSSLKDSVFSPLTAMMEESPTADASVKVLVFGESDAILTIESGVGQHYLVANFTPIPYHFQFTRELGSEWFYPKAWRDTAIYTIDSVTYQTPIPLIYSTAGTSKGWNTSRTLGENDSPVMYNSPIFDNMKKGLYTETDTLYMILEKETANNATISLNKDAVEAVRLVQFIGDKDDEVWKQDSISHSFTVGESDGEMLIPSIYDAVYEFTARIAVEKGYAIETAEYSFDTLVDRVSQSKSYSFKDGDVIALNPYAMENIKFEVDIAPIPYLIAFENTVKEGVIADGVSLESREYTVESEDPAYPNGLYTSESCLIGWKNGSSEDVLTSFNMDDFTEVKEGGITLTSVWGNVAACDDETSETDLVEGPYSRMVLDADGGSVQLVQVMRDEEGELVEIRTRKFGENNSMLFPVESVDDSWYIVKIIADDDHKALDSVQFYYDVARVQEAESEAIWIHDGEELPRQRLSGSVLKATFALANKTPIEFAEDPLFVRSADSISLVFTTSEFDATREAVVKTVLTSGEKVVVDKKDTIKATPYEYSLNKNGLADGDYKLSVMVYDGKDTVTFDSSFTINTTAIAFAEDPLFIRSADAISLVFTTSEFDATREAVVKTVLTSGEKSVVDKKDTISATPYEYSLNKSGLADGDYKLSVMVYDGKDTVTFDSSFTINTVAVAFAANPVLTRSADTISLAFSTSKFDATREAVVKTVLTSGEKVVVDKKDTIKATPYEYSLNKSGLADGDYKLSVMVYDGKDTVTFDSSFTINTVVIAFAEEPTIGLQDSSFSLQFTSSKFAADRRAFVQKLFIADNDTLVTLDTVKTIPYVFAWDTTGLAPGEYKLSVKIFDETEYDLFDTSFTIYGDTSVVDTTVIDTTVIAFAQDPEFRISGSAAHMNFVTSEFNAEREALAEVILVRNGDTTISVDSVKKTPYEFTWDTVGLAPGKYELSVRVYDTAESASYDTSFVVTGEIAAASMDGWQMLALDVIDKKSVDWNDEDAVFYWWDESSSVGEYWQYQAYGERDEVDAVTGGWYSSLEGRSIELREDLEVPDSAVWKVSNVYSGWNLVANPYGWTIANPDTTLESWRWNSELCDYDTTRPWFLKPYEAIWVRVDSDTSLALDKTPVFDTTAVKAAAKRRVLAKANNKFDWSIRAVLQDEMGKTDSWNVLGAGETDMMEEPPEGMGNHVRLSIMEGRKRLAKSMKQISEDGYTWNLDVSATSNRRGYLSFEGLDRVEAFGYRLFVTVDDRTVELSAGEKLPVALKSISKSVKVQVVKSEAQLAKSVSGLKMVQQGNRVNVSFNVPAELSGSGYIAEVAGLNGEKVSSSRGKATSGRNEVGLTLPKSGLYYVRVRVASQQTAGKFLAK